MAINAFLGNSSADKFVVNFVVSDFSHKVTFYESAT